MLNNADFLVEIHTEELPPKALLRLGKSFLDEIETRLTKSQLKFSTTKMFATPRRLAVLVNQLAATQPETKIERKGPALDAAFDIHKNPTPACVGFAKSCGISPEDLIIISNKQGEFVGSHQIVAGKTSKELLPDIIRQALTALPIPKRMRWGNNTVEFVRPVHSVLMLYGEEIIPAEILNLSTSRTTQGHRFHCTQTISITHPENYERSLLSPGFVVADFSVRKEKIKNQIATLSKEKLGDTATVVIDDDLLDEVTGLVEWPVALIGNFNTRFLKVPKEALISAMKLHQRYFPVVDKAGNLLPHFITVSNIESHNPADVIKGNERVLQARLADAAFFYETDKKIKLTQRLEKLKNIIFQNKLGTLYDKAQRIAQLAAFIAKSIREDATLAEHAGFIAKADLTTELVGEFPELQGIAAYHYALSDGEPLAIAQALLDQYKPRFAGDELPQTLLGCCVSLADRLDTLVGIFGINQQPTGDKDPYALRRAAVGVIRILIEKKLSCDLQTLVETAYTGYQQSLANKAVVTEVLTFIQDRLKPWYQDQGIEANVFAAVTAIGINQLYDCHLRMFAVQQFKDMPEAEALSIANKRVSNILAKYPEKFATKTINPKLFETSEEKQLAEKLDALEKIIEPDIQQCKYANVLSSLATLRQPVDAFFDKVMVMTEDKSLRENRLLLLTKLRESFLKVADIALLVLPK